MFHDELRPHPTGLARGLARETSRCNGCANTWLILVCPVVFLLLVGCAASSGPRAAARAGPEVELAASIDVVGPVALRPGDAAPDFRFVEPGGPVTRFSAVRGSVTALVFPRNHGDWPDPAIYREAARIIRKTSAGRNPVVIVNVGRPDQSLAAAAEVLEAAPVRSRRLFMVADPTGEIHDLYGPGAAGRYFIVNYFGRILSIGDFDGPDSLREPLRKAVREVSGPEAIWWMG